MPHYVYILWSERLKRYYCGEIADVGRRLGIHNSGGKKFTTKGIPWTLVNYFEVDNRPLARNMENKIKKRGIKRYLKDKDLI